MAAPTRTHPNGALLRRRPRHARRRERRRAALPAVAADSLSGRTTGDDRVSIPLTDVRAVYTRRRDVGRTIILLGAVAAAALAISSIPRAETVY